VLSATEQKHLASALRKIIDEFATGEGDGTGRS
jgi:hypothetical protein